MQSHNLTLGSTIFSLSFSLSLFHFTAFAAQFWDLIHFPIPIHMKERNSVAYRIVDTADSKKKVRKAAFLCPSSLHLIVTHYILEWSTV